MGTIKVANGYSKRQRDLLSSRRLQMGISAAELCDKIGITTAPWYAILSGRGQSRYIYRFLEELHIDPVEFSNLGKPIPDYIPPVKEEEPVVNEVVEQKKDIKLPDETKLKKLIYLVTCDMEWDEAFSILTSELTLKQMWNIVNRLIS